MVKWSLTRTKPAANSSLEEPDDEKHPKYAVNEGFVCQQQMMCAAPRVAAPQFAAAVPMGLGVHLPDISNDDAMVKRVWASSGPKWRVATPGLNIEGHCGNKSCEAYKGGYLLIQWGYRNGGVFDCFLNDEDCRCPMCGGYVEPTNFGFWNTWYKVNGTKKAGKGEPLQKVDKPWKLIPEADGYTTFKDSDDNMVHWNKLIITVKRP